MRAGQAAPVWLWFAGFACVWTACVVLGWHLALVPEPVRPLFRTAVWIGAVAVWVAWQRVGKPLAWLGLWPISPWQLAWTAGAFAAVFAWNLVRVSATGTPTLAGLALPPETYLRMCVGVLVEELVFRGVLQTRLAQRMPASAAVLLVGFAFLAIHIPGWLLLTLPVSAGVAVSVFLIGLICGALRCRTASLWPAVAAHAANNFGAMV